MPTFLMNCTGLLIFKIFRNAKSNRFHAPKPQPFCLATGPYRKNMQIMVNLKKNNSFLFLQKQ